MDRAIDNRNILDTFTEEFCSIVEKHCSYIIVSGFVAISTGRMRGTEDIDMIIPHLTEEVYMKLHTDLVHSGFECIQTDVVSEILVYLNEGSIRYVRKNTFVPEMEIKFAKDELDMYQLKSRVKIPLTGLDIWFSSIEMNIAFKEEYLKSEKDIEDAHHLRIVFSDTIQESEIKKCKEMIRKCRL